MPKPLNMSLEKQGIRKLVEPTIGQVRDAFIRGDARDLDDNWMSYRNDQLCWHPWDTYSPPDLELIRSSDIHVYHRNSVPCNCGHDFAVERSSAPSCENAGGNYAGYDAEQRCYAFRGQRRLFASFLDITAPLFEIKEVKLAFVRQLDLAIPFSGFPRGWDYDEFARHAKIMECMLFLKSAGNDPLKFDAQISLQESREGKLDSDMQAEVETNAGGFNSGPTPYHVSNAKAESSRYSLRLRKSVTYH